MRGNEIHWLLESISIRPAHCNVLVTAGTPLAFCNCTFVSTKYSCLYSCARDVFVTRVDGYMTIAKAWVVSTVESVWMHLIVSWNCTPKEHCISVDHRLQTEAWTLQHVKQKRNRELHILFIQQFRSYLWPGSCNRWSFYCRRASGSVAGWMFTYLMTLYRLHRVSNCIGERVRVNTDTMVRRYAVEQLVQASWVRFRMGSSGFLIDEILTAALWPWGRLSL